MTIPAGLDCKLYYDDTGWVLIPHVRDLTVNGETAEAETGSRASRFGFSLPLHKDFSIDFDMLEDPADTAFAFLEAAWLADADLEIAVVSSNADIATPGTEYIPATMGIFKFTEGQPLEDAATVSVTLKLVPGTDPAVTVAS